jgi:uncharacterized membrane protein (DUF4010 family)
VVFGVDALWHVVVAVLGGLAVGTERQWSGHASGANARFAGLRTFTMMGLIAGLSGWWWTVGLAGPAVVLLTGTVAIIGLAYAAGSRTNVDATTEIAAIVVLAAGVMAGAGQTTLASGIIGLTVLLLVEKSQLHRLVGRIGQEELLAAARFAAMATIVLPLLPAELGPFGPLGVIRPRQLWALVLFFSGLSFLGFLARRALGEHRGFAVAGVLGGLVSSTSVTLTFSRLSRSGEAEGRALASGVLGANVVLFPRVLLASAVLAPSLAAALWPAFVAPVVIGLVLVVRGLQSDHSTTRASRPGNPLELRAALQMAVLFQFVLFGVAFAESRFGTAGLYGSAAVLGLSDVDALTVSMAQRAAADTPAAIAAAALTVGILTNTLVKTAIALVVGRGPFRWMATAGLGLLAVALSLSLIF